MTLMQDLMHFAQDRSLRSNAAMDALTSEYERQPNMGGGTSNPQANLQGNAQLPSGGTPRMASMGKPPNFHQSGAPGFVNSSPGMPNMNLPMQPNGAMNGSPHIGNLAAPGMPGHAGQMGMMGMASPAQTNMAPPMVPQLSQQGTSSSAASANTSPQVNNKRRRSTVKAEEDGGGGGVGGDAKVKPSPRLGKKAKPG